MMYRLIVFLLLVLVNLVLTQYAKAEGPEYSVMSYNILYSGGESDSNVKAGWNIRKDLLFNVIESESPDIVGLQEVNNATIDGIRERFDNKTNNANEYVESGSFTRQNYENGEIKPAGLANFIYYKLEKFTFLDEGTIWFYANLDPEASVEDLHKFPGDNSTRNAVWVKLQSIIDNKIVYVFNAHIDSDNPSDPYHDEVVTPAELDAARQSGKYITYDRRKISSERIANVMWSKIAEEPEASIILLGDFNSSVKSDLYKYFTQKKQALTNWSYPEDFRQLEPTMCAQCNISTTTKKNMIDYIMVSDNVSIVSNKISGNKSSEIEAHPFSTFPSDHFAIIARVRLDTKETTTESWSNTVLPAVTTKKLKQ